MGIDPRRVVPVVERVRPEDHLVVRVADAEWGERVGAVVALREGATLTLAEVQAHVKLAGVKRPHELVLVDALPRNALG